MSNYLNDQLGHLRPVHEGDLELMLAWRNQPRVRTAMFNPSEISLEEHTKWWEETQQRSDQKHWIYEYQKQPQGVVNLKNINATNRVATWGIYTSPNAVKGAGSRMAYSLFDLAFQEFALHKIKAKVIEGNVRSINFHRSVGFKLEGVLRQDYEIEGRYIDVYCFRILREEWLNTRELIHHK